MGSKVNRRASKLGRAMGTIKRALALTLSGSEAIIRCLTEKSHTASGCCIEIRLGDRSRNSYNNINRLTRSSCDRREPLKLQHTLKREATGQIMNEVQSEGKLLHLTL